MNGRHILFAVASGALLPVIAFLVIILWMGFWQGNPGEPVVYTLAHYRAILTDSFTYKTMLNTLGFASISVAVSLYLCDPHRMAGGKNRPARQKLGFYADGREHAGADFFHRHGLGVSAPSAHRHC